MSPHRRLTEAARLVREPLYLVTGLYVVVGFCVGGYGAVTGDRLAACLGFFFVSGALGAALIFHGMSRLAFRLAAIGDHLDDLRAAMDRLERAARDQAAVGPESSPDVPVEIVDLASAGTRDPSILAGASLDRSMFPRLVRTKKNIADAEVQATPSAPPSLPDALLDDLADDPEKPLRSAFAARVRARDYAGAMVVGEQILEIFSGRPIAAEFEQLRPLLAQRIKPCATTSGNGFNMHD